MSDEHRSRDIERVRIRIRCYPGARHAASAWLGVVAAVTIAGGATGCADPYARSTTPSPVPGEQPSRRPLTGPGPPRHVSRTPVAAVRRAATLTGYWSTRTYASRQLRFAAEATGDARQQARMAAARASTDARVAERARVRVVAIRTLRSRANRRDLVLLLRERLSHPHETTARWRVVEARAVRASGGWSVARWQPQP